MKTILNGKDRRVTISHDVSAGTFLVTEYLHYISCGYNRGKWEGRTQKFSADELSKMAEYASSFYPSAEG